MSHEAPVPVRLDVPIATPAVVRTPAGSPLGCLDSRDDFPEYSSDAGALSCVGLVDLGLFAVVNRNLRAESATFMPSVVLQSRVATQQCALMVVATMLWLRREVL